MNINLKPDLILELMKLYREWHAEYPEEDSNLSYVIWRLIRERKEAKEK